MCNFVVIPAETGSRRRFSRTRFQLHWNDGAVFGYISTSRKGYQSRSVGLCFYLDDEVIGGGVYLVKALVIPNLIWNPKFRLFSFIDQNVIIFIPRNAVTQASTTKKLVFITVLPP